MSAAVAMLADTLPQPSYFGNEFFPCHLVKVGVHHVAPPGNPQSTSEPQVRLAMAPVIALARSEAKKAATLR